MKITIILTNALTGSLVALLFTATIAWQYHTGRIIPADVYLTSVDTELTGK